MTMTVQFVRHLQRHATALRVPRTGAVSWDDEALHAEAYTADPQRYALTALTPGVLAPQRARVLLQLLVASRAGLTDAARDTLARVTRVLALGLAPADVLTVLLAVRRRRANHRHVTRTVLTVLLEHPHAEEIVRARRGLAQDCFEHALGRATARACVDALGRGARPHHALLRSGTAARRLPALYRHGDGTGLVALPPAAGELDLTPGGRRRSPRPTAATSRPPSCTCRGAAESTSSARGRAVHRRRGRRDAPASRAPSRWCWTTPPRCAATASGNGRSLAGRRAPPGLDRVCARLVVVPSAVGPAVPAGPTDLATGVLDALADPARPRRGRHRRLRERPPGRPGLGRRGPATGRRAARPSCSATARSATPTT